MDCHQRMHCRKYYENRFGHKLEEKITINLRSIEKKKDAVELLHMKEREIIYF